MRRDAATTRPPARPVNTTVIFKPTLYSDLQPDKTALDRWHLQLQLHPVVAVIVTLPHLTGRKPREQLSRGGTTDQRVRHEIDWIGEAAAELLPSSTVAAKDCRLGVVGVGLDARRDRDIPAVRTHWVGGDGPAVPPVQSRRSPPGRPCVGGVSAAAIAALIEPTGNAGVCRQLMAVAHGAATVVLPRAAPVGRTHNCSSLDAGQDEVRIIRRERQAADISLKGSLSRREPEPAREDVAEPCQLPPAPAPIIADENACGLCTGVEPPGDERADHDLFHDPPFEPGMPPGPAGIVAAQDSVALGAGVDVLLCMWIRGNAAHVKSRGHVLDVTVLQLSPGKTCRSGREKRRSHRTD